MSHLSAWAARSRPWTSHHMFSNVFFIFVWHFKLFKYTNNFWQRISWFSQRWRTQRNAISSVNCRIQWIIESLNAHCASWYSGKHARFRINKNLTPNRCSRAPRSRWIWIFALAIIWNPLYVHQSIRLLVVQVQQVVYPFRFGSCLTSLMRLLTPYREGQIVKIWYSKNLIWNRVGKPAELKHINKRRKRN